jgi:DNA-binding transcriptional regulator YiaG
LPGSKAEFARTFEIGVRTVRKWDSEIADQVEALRV